MKKILLICFLLGVACAGFGFDGNAATDDALRPGRRHVPVDSAFLDVLLTEPLFANAEILSLSADGKRLWSVEGKLSEPLQGDPVEAVRSFLLEHSSAFNLPSESRDGTRMKLVRNEAGAGGHHVSFQMYIEDYPVQDALIEAHLDRDRRIRLIHGAFPTVAGISGTVQVTPVDAIELATSYVGARKFYERPYTTMELHPLSREGLFAPAYVVAIPSSDPLGMFRVVIDAETGAELDRTNEMYFAYEGKGSVYRNHPLISPLSIEPLNNLASTTLSGLFISIVNPKAPAAQSEDGIFVYDPSDTHFDEVNVYYHLNRARDFFVSLGFDKHVKPIKAVVHYGDKMDNALFDAVFGVFGFGDGEYYHSFAREESIIYHEYAHYVMVSIVKVRNAGESGAMSEGQADYFGSSMSNDPVHGEYVASKAGLPHIRTLLNSFRYPQDIAGSTHKDGRIWSGALWDLRRAVGQETADRLVLGSHYYLKAGQPSFRDGVTALLAVDANVFGGRNRQAIISVMSGRGITAQTRAGIVLEQEDLRAMKNFRLVHGT